MPSNTNDSHFPRGWEKSGTARIFIESQTALFLVQENNAPREGSLRRSEPVRAGRGRVPAPTDPGLSSDSQKGREIPDLRSSSVFTAELLPCGYHHLAEALLLFHKVVASTLSCSRHNPGSLWLASIQLAAQSGSFPWVPFPEQTQTPRRRVHHTYS